jgi:hypothetical protein
MIVRALVYVFFGQSFMLARKGETGVNTTPLFDCTRVNTFSPPPAAAVDAPPVLVTISTHSHFD